LLEGIEDLQMLEGEGHICMLCISLPLKPSLEEFQPRMLGTEFLGTAPEFLLIRPLPQGAQFRQNPTMDFHRARAIGLDGNCLLVINATGEEQDETG